MLSIALRISSAHFCNFFPLSLLEVASFTPDIISRSPETIPAIPPATVMNLVSLAPELTSDREVLPVYYIIQPGTLMPLARAGLARSAWNLWPSSGRIILTIIATFTISAIFMSTEPSEYSGVLVSGELIISRSS